MASPTTPPLADSHNNIIRSLMATVRDIRSAPVMVGAAAARRERERWANVILVKVATGIRRSRPAVELDEHDAYQARIDFDGWKAPGARPADVLPIILSDAIEAHLSHEDIEADLDAASECEPEVLKKQVVPKPFGAWIKRTYEKNITDFKSRAAGESDDDDRVESFGVRVDTVDQAKAWARGVRS